MFAAAASMTLGALDVDAEGNIIIGGGTTGELYQRDRLTSNNYATAQRDSGKIEPYIAVYDPNLKVRLKWTTPQQHKQTLASNSGTRYSRYLMGGAGSVTAIAGGAYCPDNFVSFGSCVSAFAVDGQPSTSKYGAKGEQFTTANALHVKGENNK
jgi:hypothetical protein